MPRHSLFPGFIKISYTANLHPHVQVLPVNADPTAAGGSFTIPTRGGAPVDWQDAVMAWCTLLAPEFDTAASFDTAEIYNFEASPGPADFLQGMTVGVAGTNVSAPANFGQAVFTFKGLAAAAVRPTINESTIPVDQKIPYASLGASEQAIVDFILGDDDWIAMRGGGFPTLFKQLVTKTNDKLRKKYFNP